MLRRGQTPSVRGFEAGLCDIVTVEQKAADYGIGRGVSRAAAGIAAGGIAAVAVTKKRRVGCLGERCGRTIARADSVWLLR